MVFVHSVGDLLNDRYQVKGVLGQGGFGITYLVQDINKGQFVAIKSLNFPAMGTWKNLELFEREAKVLAKLDHPAIPKYIEYFQLETPTDRRFYIARELAPGKSLEDLVKADWLANEDIAKDIATQILEILIYLQCLEPPIFHRDIKPQNIIRQENGKIALVDFGAVQDAYRETEMGGSTMIGTIGYMAPEQFRGKAYSSTDMYGLGATLIYILCGISPGNLPETNLKIEFREVVNVSIAFSDWLEKLIEPAKENRFSSVPEALNALLTGNLVYKNITPPYQSKIQIERTSNSLSLIIPGTRSIWHTEFKDVILCLSLFAPSIFLSWFTNPLLLFYVLFVSLLLYASSRQLIFLFKNVKIIINPTHFRYEEEMPFYYIKLKGSMQEIGRVKCQEIYYNHQPSQSFGLIFTHGNKKYPFGQHLGDLECEWLEPSRH